jgi:anti-sigma B factor antagonist
MNTPSNIIKVHDNKAIDFPVQLMKAGMDFLEKGVGGEMILDLTECKTIDSRTIGAIVNLTNRFSRQKRSFVLRNVNARIHKVFDFMNLTQFLFFEDGESAQAPVEETHGPRAALKVDFEVFDSVGVYKFTGAIDSSTESAMFLNIINKIIADQNRMLIDMNGITYIDSLGVGVIIRLIKLMREGKADVRFFGAGEYLRSILTLNSLHTVIHIYNTREEALKEWD